MSDAMLADFTQRAQALSYEDTIKAIAILLEKLKTAVVKPVQEHIAEDTSFIDDMCGILSHEEAEELRQSCHLKFKEVI